MYLENIHSPKDLKKLNIEQLNILCAEIREKLIETVSQNGGHLSSNLGVVELTVAVHYVFNSPNDSVLFDVGHQCYVHKLLTGRNDTFSTIRQKGGLSGFMLPTESKYDPFVSGHSSNSVSAAFGIACANTLEGNGNYTVSIVGDGAMTGGMIFEAFNNSGRRKDRMIVILNDNQMSISKNVGSLARHLSNMRIGKKYLKTKENVRSLFDKIPIVGGSVNKLLIKFKQMIKSALYNSNYFESLGYHYLGPINGNDIGEVIKGLEAAKSLNRPIVLHAITTKGIGYLPAEQNPTSYHGVSHFDVNTGLVAHKDSFSFEFGQALCDLAERDDKICAITAAMTEGTGLIDFKEKYEKRFFDVGIAEQHAITFCSGLASKGYKPVFAVYSSFLQRGYDQLVHDVSVCNYNVTLAVDRAGIVGEDGVTHQGIFDVAFLNTVPNFALTSPCYFDELKFCLDKAVNTVGPMCVRYPRGVEGYRPDWYSAECFDNDYVLHSDGDQNILIMTYGRLFSNVAEVSEKIGCSVCKINTIKPIPSQLIADVLKFDKIVFYEEGIKNGGVAELFGNMLMESGYKGLYRVRAIDDFVPHETVTEAFEELGFSVDGMIDYVMNGDNFE